MMKRILGGIVVASALLLTACGYSPAEQKFYDACIKKDAKTVKAFAASPMLGVNVSGDIKSMCDGIIKEINKRAKENNTERKEIDAFFEKLVAAINKQITE